MSNKMSFTPSAEFDASRKTYRMLGRFARVSSTTVLLVALSLRPAYSPRAQRAAQTPVNIEGVTAKPTRGGTTVVSVSADGPLNRVQTWTDDEGFHATMPYAARGGLKNLPPGVKVRQVGRSLELLVQTKPGANVTVQPNFNRLDLVVQGGTDPSRRSYDDQPTRAVAMPTQEHLEARRSEREQERPAVSSNVRTQRESRSAESAPVVSTQQSAPAQSQNGEHQSTAQTNQQTSAAPSQAQTAENQPAQTQQQQSSQQSLVPATDGSDAPANTAPSAVTTSLETPPQGGIISRLFSATGVAVMLLIGLVALFVVRKRRVAMEEMEEAGEKVKSPEVTDEEIHEESLDEFENAYLRKDAAQESEKEEQSSNGFFDRRKKGKKGRRTSDQQAAAQHASHANESNEQALEVRNPATPVLFGAYRVDQEVSKMVLGQPHRSDVLASRSTDDRRAIETSLIRCMMDEELEGDARQRARQALEDYGFVARESAALLLAHDAVDRASAARTLGEVGSPSALPFLLEALYDSEPIVRNQAVSSLGALKQPAAIGALLDLAWRHPEIPAPLLSRVLSACSLECERIEGELGFGDDEHHASIHDAFTGEITRFEPAAQVEALPEWLEDEELEEALSRLESVDVEARTAAARSLAQFQVQRAVEALKLMVMRDAEPSVRATAVNSLGAIGHESVFAPVMIAFADEAREVRAAAARSLSRLNFDRADAYVRLADSADAETMRQVALACIKGGMASQAVDRLASEDRRQAYEAFSLLAILAKANEVEPILFAIEHHDNMQVRLNAVKLLGMSGQPQILGALRHLAVRDHVPEKVRTTLLEVVYKIDQMQPA